MGRYIARRLLQAIPLLLGVSVVAFLVIQAIPGGVLGAYSAESGARAEDLARIERQLGLDKPLHVQYLAWLGRFVRGDWGYTLIAHLSVKGEIMAALPRTVLLLGIGLAVALVVGVTTGVIAAVKQYSVADMIITTLSFIGLCMPVFWFGLLLILIFSVRLKWLPGGGMYTVGEPFSLMDRVKHLILPVVGVSFQISGEYARYVRSSLLEVLQLDYVRTAHSKGLHPRTVLFRHVLRNSLIPLVTIFAMQLPWMVGGFVITESIFSWPGMGRLLWMAALQHDYPMMMSIILLVSAAVIFANLLADVMYAILDPRIVYERHN